MNHYEMLRAIEEGRKCFKITRGKRFQVAFSESLEKCKGRFTAGYKGEFQVEEISLQEFLAYKLKLKNKENE